MLKYLPFNDFDMAGITNAVTRYKGEGLRSNFNIDLTAGGIVTVVFDDPVRLDGSLVEIHVHKLTRPGWFRDKPHWVVELFSWGSAGARRHGCVVSTTQAGALFQAELDVKRNFASDLDFDTASRAY